MTGSAAGTDAAAETGSAAGIDSGAGASPGEPIRARTWPTSTTSPSPARISVTTPATGAGTSESTLSVEISKRISSTSTGSPTCLNQRMIVPSVTVSPNWGMVTSTTDPASTKPRLRLPDFALPDRFDRPKLAGPTRRGQPGPPDRSKFDRAVAQPCRDRPVNDSTLSPNSSLRVGWGWMKAATSSAVASQLTAR